MTKFAINHNYEIGFFSFQNQLFLDQLSAKLTGSPSGAMPVTSALPPPVPTTMNAISRYDLTSKFASHAMFTKPNVYQTNSLLFISVNSVHHYHTLIVS